MAKIVVVGSGISGLLSACFAAKQGHEVTVLTYGSGALTVAGGIIDLFGYDAKGNFLAAPLDYIKTLSAPHPYALIGVDNIKSALIDFKNLTSECGYTYLGDGSQNYLVPTAIGSFKPSALIPPSINAEAVFKAKKITVVGFDLLKDYYPKLITKNLKHYFTVDGKETKEIDSKVISLGWPHGRNYRDVSALDIARALETQVGRMNFVNELKKVVTPEQVLIVPPILGERPELSAEIQQELEQSLKVKLVEVSSIPPSVTGLRLDRLLTQVAEKLNVTIVEKMSVIGHRTLAEDSELDKVKTDASAKTVCTALLASAHGKIREYHADAFIIATGGFFGDGLVTAMGRMYEPIFNLEIPVPQDQKDWSHQYLFTGKAQPFATYGVAVNQNLQPISPEGQVLYSNVLFAGRSLQGYDFCFEKSGNGVCLASAHHAANMLSTCLAAKEGILKQLQLI